MEKEITVSEKKFLAYLELHYNDNTVRQYLRAFRTHSKDLLTQEGVNKFLIQKAYKRGNNPFYKGFVKAYIECFELPFIVPKSKRKNQTVKKEYKFLTKDEVYDLITKIEDPWLTLLTQVYFETGLRLRELMNAKVKDINIADRTIKGMGKGNKPFTVKFSQQTADLIQKRLETNKLKYPFHFDNAKVDQARRYWWYLKKAGTVIGIENVHPHRLRHALGHYLRADMGFDLQQIKVKLRHSKLETTDIYTEATQEEVDKKIDEEVFK